MEGPKADSRRDDDPPVSVSTVLIGCSCATLAFVVVASTAAVAATVWSGVYLKEQAGAALPTASDVPRSDAADQRERSHRPDTSSDSRLP